ncbi:hypothetical protein ACOMHN_002327 [Nucella lapillus]
MKQLSVQGLSEPGHKITIFNSFQSAAGCSKTGRPLQTTECEEDGDQAARDELCQQVGRSGSWSLVMTLVQMGVSAEVRDRVCVQPEEWDSFTATVSSALRISIQSGSKQRIREFALEKAVSAGQEDYILLLFPEQKLQVSVLQSLARRIARGSGELAVNLMTKMGHSNFTEHVWAQAISERCWHVVERHVYHILVSKNLDHRVLSMLSNIDKKRRWLHRALCDREGPLRVHGSERCLVYEGVIMLCMRHTFNNLFAMEARLKAKSTREKRDFQALCLNCRNKEFFLDLFEAALKKALECNFTRLYGFLLKQLPLILVDVSKRTSCEIVLKSLLSAVKSPTIRRLARSWLGELNTDPKYLSDLVDIIFKKEDWREILPALVKVLCEETLVLPDFLWLYFRALIRQTGRLTDLAPLLNKVLKTVPAGIQSPLVLSLHRLSMAERAEGHGASLNVTSTGPGSKSSSSDKEREDEPAPTMGHCEPEHAWTAEDKTMVAFSGQWLLGWCKDRSYTNLVFFLSFLLKHAGCAVDWKVVSDMPGAVSDFLLLEGVNYAALDGSCASAASMLRRCTWDGITLKACSQVLYFLLLKDKDRLLSLLITACDYAGLSLWSSFLTFKKLLRDEEWKKIGKLTSSLKRADRVLFEEIGAEAVSHGHWEVFVNMVRRWFHPLRRWAHLSAGTMRGLLDTAMNRGHVRGAAAARSLLDLYSLHNYLPVELLPAAMASPKPTLMTRVCIAAGAAILYRKMEPYRPATSPCAMTQALGSGEEALVNLLLDSGACSSNLLRSLDRALTVNNGRLAGDKISAECQEALRDAASSPRSLQKLAGFALSDAVGLHPGRPGRIQGLLGPRRPCPRRVQQNMCYVEYLHLPGHRPG